VPYYETLDLAALVRSRDGDAAAARFVSTHAPLEPGVSLARTRGVVVLPGSGFGAPPWTIRVSLANLSEADFEGIGRAIRDALAEL
jgi:aspartate 4-decarboxylase